MTLSLARKTPMKRVAQKRLVARSAQVGPKRQRRWTCAHCRVLNAPVKRKCARCGIGRATKRKSLSTRCDSIWAQIVKAGGLCQAAEYRIELLGLDVVAGRQYLATAKVECGGVLDAAHVVPRRHRSTRWDPTNGRALCRNHHRHFTGAEHEWRSFIGPEWDRLWVKAQTLWDKSFPVAELSDALRVAREAA